MSSYLKAMQLTKQLEEKAKEEKKNRQFAEDELKEVEEFINSAKSSDIEAAKAEQLLVEASSAYAEKNYKDALSLVRQSNDQIHTDFGSGIQSILDSVNSLAEIVEDIGVDCSAGMKSFEQAKTSLDEKEYEKSVGLAKESWEVFEKIAQEQLSESFSAAQSMIVLARNSGEDVSNSEDQLEQARKSIDAQEYSVAFAHLKECLESVGTELSTQVEELLDEAKGYQITAKELGADTSRIDELVNRTEEDIKANNLESAMSSARLSRSEAEKTISRAISSSIENNRSAIQEAEAINADTEKAMEILDKAGVALKNGNYGDAITALKDCSSEIENAQFQTVLHTISQSRSKFIVANKAGADLEEAMSYLNDAREALKEGMFKEALSKAEKGDQVVEELIKEFQDIEDTIARLEDQIKIGTKNGVDLSAPESSLETAKEALESRDLETVASFVRKAKDELSNAQYAHATDCIETAELVISAGDKLGANLDDPEQLMKSAIGETKDGNYQHAIELAEESTSKAEEIIKIHVSNTIASAELAIYDAENVDIDVINDLIDKAKTEFEAFAFDKAFEFSNKALNMLETAQSGKSRELVRNLGAAISAARKMGCDVQSLEDTQKECREYMTNRDFTSASEHAGKAYDEAVNLQYVAAERMFGEAKLAAIEAKKLGIDITDMREALKRAKLAFSEENFEKTHKESENAKKAAERQVELHQLAYEAITQAAAMVAEAKKKKADIEQVMSTLASAKNMFEHFDYENAKREAEKAKEETENVLNQFATAEKLDRVQEQLPLLESLEDVDLGELRNIIEETKTSLKNKDYENAISLAEDSETKAKRMLESGVNDIISKGDRAVMDATDVGINVSEQAKKLEQARAFLQASKFSDAIESAKGAIKEISSIKELSQRAAVEIKLAQGSLNEGEALHADMDKAKKFLSKALSELKNAKYDDAIDLASKSTAEARKSIEGFVSETIKTVKVGIEKAKMEGTTVIAAEKLMDQATKSYDNKDYKTAIGLAMKSEGELEKVGLQQEMADKAISTAVKKLKDAKELGMHSSKAVSLLEEAKKEARKGKYVKALEHAIQSGDELHNVTEDFREVEDTLKLLQDQIDMATNISAEISIAKKLMADAQSARDDNDYRTATEIAKEGVIEARRLSHSKLNSALSEAYKLADLAAKYDIDVSGVNPLMAEAKTFMGTGKFEVSNEKINYCLEELKGKLKAHVLDVVEQSVRSMTHAKEVGADITESERLLTSARIAQDTDKFKEALTLAEQSKNAIDMEKGFEREFIELAYDVEKVVSNSKKFGINMKETEEMFKSARELKESNYKAAIDTLKKSLTMANAAVDDFRPKLTADIVLDRVVKDTWMDTEIIVRNEGKSLAKNVKINILGDISFEGQNSLESLRGGGGEEKLSIKVKFETLGDMPVIIRLTSTRIMDGKVFEDESIDNVFVSEPGAATPAPEKATSTFEKMIAPSETKCGICMGKVKQGLDIIRCSCGKDYHAMCGTRAGKCPGCGTEFIDKAEEDAGIGDLEVAKRPLNGAPEPPKDEEKVDEPEAEKKDEPAAPEQKEEEKKDEPEGEEEKEGQEPEKPVKKKKKRFGLRF